MNLGQASTLVLELYHAVCPGTLDSTGKDWSTTCSPSGCVKQQRWQPGWSGESHFCPCVSWLLPIESALLMATTEGVACSAISAGDKAPVSGVATRVRSGAGVTGAEGALALPLPHALTRAPKATSRTQWRSLGVNILRSVPKPTRNWRPLGAAANAAQNAANQSARPRLSQRHGWDDLAAAPSTQRARIGGRWGLRRASGARRPGRRHQRKDSYLRCMLRSFIPHPESREKTLATRPRHGSSSWDVRDAFAFPSLDRASRNRGV